MYVTCTYKKLQKQHSYEKRVHITLMNLTPDLLLIAKFMENTNFNCYYVQWYIFMAHFIDTPTPRDFQFFQLFITIVLDFWVLKTFRRLNKCLTQLTWLS